MKKRISRRISAFAALALLMISAAVPFGAQTKYELTEYVIDDLGISISLPSQAFVTGRNVPENFPPLETYGMTAAELRESYIAKNIYFNALWYDDDADVSEIVVSMITDDDIEDLFNLDLASDYELERIQTLYFDYSDPSANGARYYETSVVRGEQAVFIRAAGTVDGQKQRVNHLQYMTIVNGQRVTITLFEYLTPEEGQSAIDLPALISDSHRVLMDDVIRSVRWKHIKGRLAHAFRNMTAMPVISLAGVVALIVLYAVPYIKKRFFAADESAEKKDENTSAEASSDEEAYKKPEDKEEPESSSDSSNTQTDEAESDENIGDTPSEELPAGKATEE